MNLNEQAKIIHAGNAKWWTDINTGEPIKRNKKELLALVISELIEALEGERKNLMDDHLPHRKMAEVEMADAYIRLLDYAGGFGLDLPVLGFGREPEENKGESIFNLFSCVREIGVSIDEADEAYFVSFSIASIYEYCKKHGYDLDGAIAEKLYYNSHRKDHTHEARKQAGGKQF
jgi:hypothetical protein